MKTVKLFVFVCLSYFLTGSMCLAEPQEHQSYKGSKEIERIKKLAGKWQGKTDMGKGEMEMNVEYRVVAGGSAVEERVFAGTPMEMITMYHDKGGKLSLTHYCMLHNQPAMMLKKSDDKSLSFDFDKRCGIDPNKEAHMHALTLTFNEDGSITHD